MNKVEKKLDNFIKYSLLKEKEPDYYIGIKPARNLIILFLSVFGYLSLMFYIKGDTTFLETINAVASFLIPCISLLLVFAFFDARIFIYRYSKWSEARKKLLEEMKNEIE